MPAPLIVGALVVALGGSAVGLATLKLIQDLANKRLAILGTQRVGKTTLFHMLRDGKLSGDTEAIHDPEPGTTFTLQVRGKDVRFHILEDLPGDGGVALREWRTAFERSNHVWYLFRADLIAANDQATVEVVTTHLTLFKSWLATMRGRGPKILLVGTFADQIDGFPDSKNDIRQAVAAAEAIKAGVVKLNHAGLVVGSLATAPMAKSLLKSITTKIAK